jgi:hypothetical protein
MNELKNERKDHTSTVSSTGVKKEFALILRGALGCEDPTVNHEARLKRDDLLVYSTMLHLRASILVLSDTSCATFQASETLGGILDL